MVNCVIPGERNKPSLCYSTKASSFLNCVSEVLKVRAKPWTAPFSVNALHGSNILGRLVFCALITAMTLCLLASCTSNGENKNESPAVNVEGRGTIYAVDGTVLAQTSNATGKSAVRSYPLEAAASSIIGSCYTQDSPDGIEQVYAADLEAGCDVALTIDPTIQQAAYDALGDNIGAIVVMDPESGALLAMASSPSYDPMEQKVADTTQLEQRTTELHIPGSTMKTIVLSAALESGNFTLQNQFDAPAEISFPGGSVINYNATQYPTQSLLESYAKSINTVFAQLTLMVGFDRVYDMAKHFGFERELMSDFPLRASLICNAESMDARMQAWTGAGQALYQGNGELYGPVMSPVHGAAIASVFVNGGKLVQPYLVESVNGQPKADAHPIVLDEAFLSENTIEESKIAMRAVVTEGTGSNAQVEGVDVGGKTGTAETITSFDDAWFVGFAQAYGKSYSIAVLLEGKASSDAARVSSQLIRTLFY